MSFSESIPKFVTATGFSFAIALLLSVSVAVYSLHNVHKFQEAEIWIDHTQGVIQQLEEALSTVKDLAGYARSYALTGKTEYLDLYTAARDALPPMMTSIRQAVADNPEQVQRENALAALITRRIGMAQLQIEKKISSKADIFTFGQDVTNQIRAGFLEMKTAENNFLVARSRDSNHRALITRLAIIAGNLISLVILVSVFLRLRKEMLKRHLAQIQAQKSARESEDLYNLAPCGYHSIDATGTIVRMNDTGLQWFGYSRSEMIGKLKAIDLMAPEYRTLFTEEIFPILMNDGVVSVPEVRYLRKDGSAFIAAVNATAVRGPDNRFLMSRTVLNDISERKYAETRIGDLNDALSARATQLELANKELEGFSYSVSHDLRAPLRVIGGYAMMLEEDCAAALDAEGRRYLEVIRSNTRKMDALIVDLLKLAKSTLTPLTMAQIDMQRLVHQICKDMEIDVSGIIVIGDLYCADGNATLIQQVWQNLLANALKFSSKQAHPCVRISAEQSAQENIYCVEDNGVGFDQQRTPKLFEVFQRFHAQEQFPGTGIGLALVKRIVLRHGGRVWAQSEVGAGARFYFSLPRIPVTATE